LRRRPIEAAAGQREISSEQKGPNDGNENDSKHDAGKSVAIEVDSKGKHSEILVALRQEIKKKPFRPIKAERAAFLLF
jgi:hypothetical protein